jgi:hypothetical protein
MIPEVPDLAEKVVVGRANGRHLSLDHLKEWVSSHWKDLGFPFVVSAYPCKRVVFVQIPDNNGCVPSFV